MLKINTRELVSDSISYFNVRNVPLALLRLIQWTYSFLKYLITSSILRIVRLIFGVLSIFLNVSIVMEVLLLVFGVLFSNNNCQTK